LVRSLQSTYWAATRTREVIIESLSSSLCFGAYVVETKQQVGFARVVTDGATFSWLCDVFVDSEHRSRGLGKRLVAEIIEHPKVKVGSVFLGTKDAHGLYEKFGFSRWELMRRLSIQPNQALEHNDPSSHAGCCAPVAPAGVVAHL
jgi:GNAT superfamily N-acetyltransferase